VRFHPAVPRRPLDDIGSVPRNGVGRRKIDRPNERDKNGSPGPATSSFLSGDHLRGRSQGGLDILHMAVAAHGYYELRGCNCEQGGTTFPVSLAYRRATCDLRCAALLCANRHAMSVDYLAQVKSIQVVATSQDTLGLRFAAPIMAAAFTR